MEYFVKHDLACEIARHFSEPCDVICLMRTCTQIHAAFTKWREPLALQLPTILSATSKMDFEEDGEDLDYYNYVYYPEVHFVVDGKFKPGLKLIILRPSAAYKYNYKYNASYQYDSRTEFTFTEFTRPYYDRISIITRPEFKMDAKTMRTKAHTRTSFPEFDYEVTFGDLSKYISNYSSEDYYARFVMPTDYGPVSSSAFAFKIDTSECDQQRVYCFHPDTQIRLHCEEDSSAMRFKRACELSVGDRVYSKSDPLNGSVIEAITVQSLALATAASGVAKNGSGQYRAIEMVRIGDAWLTKGHPVRLQSCSDSVVSEGVSSLLWCRGSDCSPVVELRFDVPALYNFVVRSREALVISACGDEAATLGQFCVGVDDANGEVSEVDWEAGGGGGGGGGRASESFFGSERVVDYLKRMASWPNVTMANLWSGARKNDSAVSV